MTSPSAASLGATPVRAPATERLGSIELNRLRWRCRRGMLENDLVLARFLDARGPDLSPAESASLDRLLALADDRLWEVICGTAEPDDPALGPLVACLRAL